MRCTVCEQDKEIKQFQTYWHSTQNKMRTRKQCTECLYKIRLKRKNPDKYYQDNPNYHKCNTCRDWKLIKEFYTSNDEIYSNRCRVCTKELDRTKRREYLEQSCGSEKVLMRPNKYMDEYQKNCTFNLMETLGYTFDEPTGIWTKPGVKEIVDGKPYFPNMKTGYRTPGTHITTEMVHKMVELRKLNWGFNKIADKLGISDTTVFNHLKKYGEIN
jgi:hypothetical protein